MRKIDQSIFRVQKNKDNPYVMLNKEFLDNPNLSLKAKGLLAYLLCMPDDWKIYENELIKHHKDGKDSLKSALKELINLGYITRERTRSPNGQLQGSNYCVYEVPAYNGLSNIGKSATTNNNSTNKGKIKNKYRRHRKDGILTSSQLDATINVAKIELHNSRVAQ